MNIWALLASLILSWNLSVSSTDHLPLINIEEKPDGIQAVLIDKVLSEKILLPHKKDNKSWGVKISAQAAAVLDEGTGLVLWQKNADNVRSLASITKLMTALVFLEHNPGWDTLVTMQAEDETNASKANIYRGEVVTVKDLFYTSLVASDNNATKALVRSTGMSEGDFIKLMNAKAKDLKLDNTAFFEVTGLNDNNHSTALDILKLADMAFNNPDIKPVVSTKNFTLVTQSGRSAKVVSTNLLLKNYLPVQAGKTGSTNSAGFCLVAELKGDNGQKIISVVLDSDTHANRFQDLKILSAWILNNYTWS